MTVQITQVNKSYKAKVTVLPSSNLLGLYTKQETIIQF